MAVASALDAMCPLMVYRCMGLEAAVEICNCDCESQVLLRYLDLQRPES